MRCEDNENFNKILNRAVRRYEIIDEIDLAQAALDRLRERCDTLLKEVEDNEKQ